MEQLTRQEKSCQQEARLARLVDECRRFKMARFQEDERSAVSAFHIPYSGPCHPDYVTFNDYLEEDVRRLIVELVENSRTAAGDTITTLEQLKDAWERIDDEGLLHERVESSLTWQQGLRECEIILDNCQDEETDRGLWEGQPPVEAIRTQAFFTYKAEVFRRGLALIEERIGEDSEE